MLHAVKFVEVFWVIDIAIFRLKVHSTITNCKLAVYCRVIVQSYELADKFLLLSKFVERGLTDLLNRFLRLREAGLFERHSRQETLLIHNLGWWMRKVRFLHPNVHGCDCWVELGFLLLDELIHVIKRARTLLVPKNVSNVLIDRWILSIRILLTPEKLRLLQLFDALFFVTIYIYKHAILHILKGQNFLRTIGME